MKSYPGYTRKPFYYETDKMGIIHHSNYIRWFEEARVDLLEFAGYPFERIEREGIIVPVLGVSSTYKEMVRFGDEVLIHPIISKYTGTRLNFEYQVINLATETITTLGTSEHCFMSSESNRLVHLKRQHPTLHQLFMEYYKTNEEA
ncbi:acyl-CoA thioesterase [Enterococcus sp. AZ072]|uniref:acyl-CoA thioesterase n=1 Tax=unclassified Enterococcus TaxID=2608891 RepID=UPI003D2A7E90